MLNVAIKAARRAGNVINRASLNLERLQVDRKQHNDFVTEVDKAAEEAIIEILTDAYPTHGFLAEETGEHNPGAEWSMIRTATSSLRLPVVAVPTWIVGAYA